jgi:hypothetical protein
MILFKKQLFDLEVKDQGRMKVIMVHDTLPYGHAPTYQISLPFERRETCCFSLIFLPLLLLPLPLLLLLLSEAYPDHNKVIMVHDTLPYGHAPTYQISLTYLERQKCYGPDKKILFKKQLFDLEVKVQGVF